MVTTRHGATTTEDHAEEPNRTEDTMTGPRAGEDVAGDRVARLEERLDHMTALVERLLEAQVQGMRVQPQPYVAPMASTGQRSSGPWGSASSPCMGIILSPSSKPARAWDGIGQEHPWAV